jgi:hypothetical protein
MVGVPDHFAEESGERAELHRFPFGSQVDAAVNQRSYERQIGFAPSADELRDQSGQARFVFFL